jgi:hypothetical protein
MMGNAPCMHVDGEFCDKCWPPKEKLQKPETNNFAAKIILHQRAYEAIGEPVPPYRCTLMEWEKEFVKFRKATLVPVDATLLSIHEYMGVQIELVIKIN